jgi:hypothetical protein
MFSSPNGSDETSVWERGDESVKNEQEQQKIDIQKQNTELKQQEIQLQKQQQDTNATLVTGGLIVSGALVLVVSIYLIIRLLRKQK